LIQDGRLQLNQGRYDRALDRFERAVTIDPASAYGYYFLAQLHFQTKKYDQAVAFASRAVVLSARADRVLMGRSYGLQGAAFEAVGRYADARSAYKKAVEADPNNLGARVGIARLNPEH
jgi:tetratricopeptide (TPR) repeat protein